MENFDVIAVNIENKTVRLMAQDKSYKNAEAIVNWAVMRRGVDEEFYAVVPCCMYHPGDLYRGDGGAKDPTPDNPNSTIFTTESGMGYPKGPRGLD